MQAGESAGRKHMDGIVVNDRHALARLKHLGDELGEGKGWRDYVAEFGLGPEHVDALIAMACDPELLDAEPGTDAEWAPVHAWRALGQMRASSFIEPLLGLLRTIDDDVLDSDATIIFGMIGPVAIPSLKDVMSDPFSPDMLLISAMSALQEIAGRHPDRRSECIDILLESLFRPDSDHTMNGFAVSSLIDLRALEVIRSIRDAFRCKLVDISICGDLEDVEIELGLRTHRVTPKPRYNHRVPIAEPIRREKIGRNEPCPCGSGRKYKKCCLH